MKVTWRYVMERAKDAICYDKLFESQMEYLKDNLILPEGKQYLLEYSNGYIRFEYVIDGLQYLAVKDGADIVRFNDGNIGFVSEYGNETEWFKIIKEAR
jgi:hypothetical protein